MASQWKSCTNMDELKEIFFGLCEAWKESDFLGKSALAGVFVGVFCLFLLVIGMIILCFITSPIIGVILVIGFWAILSALYLLTIW